MLQRLDYFADSLEHLFGHDELDERLRLYVKPVKPVEPTEVRAEALPDSDGRDRLSRFIQSMRSSQRIVIHLQGPYGVGKQGMAEELDVAFMARRFEVTGGNIRNIALAAAFLAADDDGRVAMGHLLRATQREYQKMGKVITGTEFGKAMNSSLKPLTTR